MHRFLIIVFFLLLNTIICVAQIEVNDATVPPFTPENLITNYFLGEGIEVLDVKYEGAAVGVGYFNNASSKIGIQKGIVLTNGFAASTGTGASRKYGIDADGIQIASNDNKVNINDPDINVILNSISGGTQKSTNLSKYTIRFIPSADTLRFRYVFASEEYPEFVCDKYNDVFGFFISGPSIIGPYENKGQNIALIPGTNLPVTINNINLGKGSANCPPKYPQFYHNNDKTNVQPVYDGFLDVFTAQAIVQPCQIYTIKLIVADVGDASYDSGVFLEAKSFGTAAVQVESFTVSQDNHIVEGCSAGSITFRLPKKAEKDTPINCAIIGNAINGLDIKRIPTNYFIAAGDSILKVQIEALDDGVIEGIESVGFDIQKDNCDRDTVWIFVKDNDFVTVPRKTLLDSTICKGQEIVLDATVNLAIPPGKKFENLQNTPINTVLSNSGAAATVLPILVSNVSPLQFTPEMLESVCINVQHPWIDDVDIFLVAPNGQFISLTSDNGGSGDNYNNTCFTPSANNSIVAGVAPFNGNWQPEENFQNLVSSNNNPVNGVWKLLLVDDQAGLDGIALNWNISFKSNYSFSYNWIDAKDLSCSDCPIVSTKPKNSNVQIVEIEDIYGCKIVDKSTITVADSLPAPSVVCAVSTHSSVTYSWLQSLEISNYEVQLNNGNWQSVGANLIFSINNIAPGTSNTINVRGTGGKCSAKSTSKTCTTLPCTTVFPDILLVKNISCFGKKDGQVQLRVKSGGSPPFSFSLGSNENTAGFFDSLSAGIHEILIKDFSGCPARVEVEIIEPKHLLVTTKVFSGSCHQTTDGKAEVKIEGGIAPYSIIWTTGEKTAQISNLKAGKYFLTVSDQNSCQILDSLEVQNPKPIELKAVVYSTSCFNTQDGKAKVSVISGGTAPFTFLWNTTKGLQPGPKVIYLSPSDYTVTATDINGCSATADVSVGSAPNFSLLKSVNSLKCKDDKNASIKIDLSGGQQPYTYRWNNGDSTNVINNLVAGKYSLTVTDANKCEVIDSVVILEPSQLSISSSKITNVSCNQLQDGAIKINATGGTGRLNYFWSNGQFQDSILNLKAGMYIVTVSDLNSCSIRDSFFIDEPDSLLITASTQNLSCNSISDGSINVSVRGGTLPYQYLWSTGETSASITSLKEGQYSLTVVDGHRCISSADYTISRNAGFKLFLRTKTQQCIKTSSGKVETEIVGGTPPFLYVWNTVDTTAKINDLNPGWYSCTVSDSKGCVILGNTEVKSADSLFILHTLKPIRCSGSATAEIEIIPGGGKAPFLYQIDKENYTDNRKFSRLKSGSYVVSIRDSNSCTASAEVVILEPKPLLLTVSPDTSIIYGDSISISLIYQNARGALNFNWLPGEPLVMSCNNCSNPTVYPKISSTFTVIVTDSLGCTNYTSTHIKVNHKNEIFVPTGFSPNNDGENDMLYIFGSKGAEIISFRIFDKWGDLLFLAENFITNDLNIGWDGYSRGELMQSGVYPWQAKVRFKDGSVKVFKGGISLLR